MTTTSKRQTNLSGSDEGGVALVTDALGDRAAAGGASAPAGVEIPEVGAARRAHELQALPAVVPPGSGIRGGKVGREGGREGGRGGGGVYEVQRNAFHPT